VRLRPAQLGASVTERCFMNQQRSSSNLIVIAIILGPACDGLDPDSFRA